MADAPDLIYQSLTGDQAIANARLISAAPDLLTALQQVMIWISNWNPEFVLDEQWQNETAPLVAAAIKKAEGTS